MSAGTILFAAGRGGSPSRHSAMIGFWREAGIEVIAPEFAMLPMGRPTPDNLLARIAILREALDVAGATEVAGPVTGIGHSIGGTLLLAMAGAHIWTGPGAKLAIDTEPRLARLVMLAPPVGALRAPHSLDGVQLPVMLRSGSADETTPSADHRWLAQALGDRSQVDFAVVEGAGHFTFMDQGPPGMAEPMRDAPAYRARLASEILAFHQASG